MMLKRKVIFIFSILAVVFSLSLIFFIDRSPILDGVEFSSAFSDSDGKLMKVFLTSDEKYRIFRDITSVPPEFAELVIQQEDKRFLVHNGVNPFSVLRAAFSTYVMKTRVIGASTITMQTAKLRYGIDSHKVTGKLLQILYALRLEFNHSKQEILEAYLNLAPCGRNIEGFEAASQYFFSKTISELNHDEQVLLCVLPQNPVKRCPSKFNFPDALKDAMCRLDDTVTFPSLVCEFPEEALHFSRLMKTTNRNSKGIVKTSINHRLQEIIDRKISLYTNSKAYLGIKNASAILVDSKSMKVLAYTGSSGFYNDEILGQNDGNISKRSPGSTLKPFIYALALEQGLIHSQTLLKDTPTAFSEYAPDNYGNDFKGPIFACEALIQSRNIPAVALARKIKNPDLYDFLKNADISNLKEKDNYGLSIVLGSAELTAVELAELYCSLLNEGKFSKIRFTDSDKTDSNSKKILSAESCFIIKDMLEKNQPADNQSVEERCDSIADKKIGFKTGTSIGFRDAWTCGFFGDYVLVVWIGNFDGSGNNSFLGRSAATPLFFNIADEMFERGFVKTTETDFEKLNVKKVEVCSVSGCLPNDDCPSKMDALFIPGVSPIEKCKIHQIVNENGKSVVREFWSSEFLELFALTGLPRTNPETDKIYGKNPEILSPLANVEYFISNSNRNTLILRASAESDAGELFWSSGRKFIAKSQPNEKVEWKPNIKDADKNGEIEITVTDSKGRSSSRIIKISKNNF